MFTATPRLSPQQQIVKTELAWTPGEWMAYPADYQRPHDNCPLPIFTIGPEEFHTVAQVRAGSSDDDLPAQTKANAYLIAAAPELYEALALALPYLHADTSAKGKADYSVLRHAIAKARGERS